MPCASYRAVRVLAATLLFALPASVIAQSAAPESPFPPAQPHSPDEVLPHSAFPAEAVPPSPAEWPPPPPPPAAPPVDGPMLSPFAGAPWASPTVGHVPYAASYHGTWLPDESVSGQNAHLGMLRNDLSVKFPLWQTDHDEVSGNIHVQDIWINTNAILPSTGQAFPDQLWDVRVGASYRHLFENGWIAGGSLNVGSASNEPFHSINEMTAGFSAFLRVPQGEHNAWLFSLSYSPTGELNFPVPGVAFVWVPNDQLRMNLGLPFMILYRPTDDITLEASYMLLTTVHARATYRICKPVRVYVGFETTNESWYVVPRLDNQERLFYYENRVAVGALINFGRMFLFDVSGGYAFDRFFFEGDHSSDRSFNRVDVGAAPLLSIQAQLRW